MPHAPAPVPADLMTYEQAAQQLGITLDSMRTAVTRGRIRPVKLPGRHYKFLRQRDVDEYQQKRHVDYREESQEEAQALAPVAQQQLSPEEAHAYARAFAAPMADHYGNMADRAVPGILSAMVSGFQVLRGQQPTFDPKALAV